MRRFVLAGLLLATPVLLHAQASSPARMSPSDSLFRRARRMVTEGNGVAGRALVDSLLHAAPEGSSGYGDALYWHGALAETAADAERDYRRVIVEYPLSLYADDALLALAELEQARGDRAGALQHLQRFVREHPVSTARGVAALAGARLAFEQRDTRTACSLLADARGSASVSDVELRNQVDYYSGRCEGVAVASAPAPVAPASPVSAPVAQDVATPAATKAPTTSTERARTASRATPAEAPDTRPDVRSTGRKPASIAVAPGKSTAHDANSAPKPTSKGKPSEPAAHAAKASATIQLAAYNTRADAERLVRKLGGQGVHARVSGDAKPFRVRLGFYPSHDAAAKEVAALRKRGIVGFVTTEARASEAKSP